MRKYLIDIREKLDITQAIAAQRMEVSQPHYCEIEKGTRQRDMSYSMMEKLAAAFGVPVETIIEAEKEYIAKQETA